MSELGQVGGWMGQKCGYVNRLMEDRESLVSE